MNKESIILSDYEIKGILGKGTFSKVKLGINKITNEKVAIKIIDKQSNFNENNYDRIKREISILKSSTHPNIIKIFDIKEDSKNYYFIMEYCQYGELFHQIVNNKHLDDKESAFYFFQLINGLNYLHINKIAHRDLKPENLLLSKGKILKIIDFGLSNYSIDNQYLNTPCGSPSYASPEMIKGKKYNGFISDIWSCGIILYVMLVGYLPFEGFNNNDLFKKILKCKVNYPINMDKSAIDLLKNILILNPDKRIGINKIKQHPFYLKGKSIFKKKYPELIIEVEKANFIDYKKTLKKSFSEIIHLDIENENINNKVNNDNDKDQNYNNRRNNICNSANKNENQKCNNIVENIKMRNFENNLYNNLLSYTKNINYYKKILTEKFNFHSIRKNKNNSNDKNEIKIQNRKIYYNNNILPNNKLNISITRDSETLPSNNNEIKNKLSNNNQESNKKNYINNNGNYYNKNENNSNINDIENLKNNREISENKKFITNVTYNDNNGKSNYIECHSPNYLLLKELLKNSKNHSKEEGKEMNIMYQSIVYNTQRDTKILNVNHTIHKIKKLKRIYENEINNGLGNEKKTREYFSSNNSNSKFKINIKKDKNKIGNDISQNNHKFKKNSKKNIYNENVSPIKKMNSLINSKRSKEKKNFNKKLVNFKSIKNNIFNRNKEHFNDEIFLNNNYFVSEDKENNSIQKKILKINDNNIDTNTNEIFNCNNHKNLHYQFQKKKSQNNFSKHNKVEEKESERNNQKNPHIITNSNSFNSLNKSPLSKKDKIDHSSNNNYSISIKVNKRISKNFIRNDNNKVKKNNCKQCSLTNKLVSIKNNFHLSNKDILISDKRKEDLINYKSHNTKMNSANSQKYIKNRTLDESSINSSKNNINRKKSQYNSLIDKISISNNNSNFCEIQLNQINNDNNDWNKNKNKRKNYYSSYNHRLIFLKKHKYPFEEDKNYNSKRQRKTKSKNENKNRNDDLEKNNKYYSEYTSSKEYSKIETSKNLSNWNTKNNFKFKINRSSSISKGSI